MPCKQMAARMHGIPFNDYGILLEEYDAHEFPLVTEKLGARGVPFFALIDSDGETIRSRTGMMSVDELVDFMTE